MKQGYSGGIISYDTNVSTGGIGAEYFGIGASELYREDQVSVYLRAVDVYTGQAAIGISQQAGIFTRTKSRVIPLCFLKRLAEFQVATPPMSLSSFQ